MSLLPQPDTTVRRIYKHYESKHDPHRWHLGASLIGRPCSRALWYTFRWCSNTFLLGRILRLFETGQLAEDRFIQNLRDIGVAVAEFDPDSGEQFVCSDIGGHFGGSLDGIGLGFVEAPKTEHVIEMKTHGDKSFKELLKKEVKESKPEHWIQMNTYMGYQKLKRAFYIAVNKNTDELYSERFRYDAQVFKATKEKARQIIASSKPLEKISHDPSWYICKFCDHNAICHSTTMPEINCRTCCYSTPVMEGTGGVWRCSHYKCEIPETKMRTSVQCPSHLFIPPLLENWAEPVNADDDYIEYKNKLTGEVFKAGPSHYSSQELKAAKDKRFIGSPVADELKDKFDGTVVG